MNKKTVAFTLCILTAFAVALCFLVVHGPHVEQAGMFSAIKVPGMEYQGTVGGYFREFFSSLKFAGWVKFVLGVLFGLFLYVGVPQLVERYGGKGWREGG